MDHDITALIARQTADRVAILSIIQVLDQLEPGVATLVAGALRQQSARVSAPQIAAALDQLAAEMTG